MLYSLAVALTCKIPAVTLCESSWLRFSPSSILYKRKHYDVKRHLISTDFNLKGSEYLEFFILSCLVFVQSIEIQLLKRVCLNRDTT